MAESCPEDREAKLAKKQEKNFVQNVESTKEIKVVFVGRSGAGKSTLLESMFDIKRDRKKSLLNAKSDTVETKTWHKRHKNGINVAVTDTVGLEEGNQADILQKLSDYFSDKEIDLLVYCLSVALGSRFSLLNPKIVKALKGSFDKKIWKHCFVVFTFSNQPLDQLLKEGGNKEEIEAEYKAHIKEYGELFEKEIKETVDKDFKVNVIFGLQSETPMETTIVAIPVGNVSSTDEVLPDFIKENVIFTIDKEQVQLELNDWKDVVFTEMVKKCHRGKDLLKYRYGPAIFIGGVVGGAVAGSAAGGVVGGPVGAVVGAGVGAGVATVKLLPLK